MLAKLEDLKLVDSAGKPLEWAETLVVDTDEPLKVPDVNDDLARETLMYAANSSPVSSVLCVPVPCLCVSRVANVCCCPFLAITKPSKLYTRLSRCARSSA